MNKQFLLLITLVALTLGSGRAQIQFEQSFNYSGTFARLEQAGQKFLIMDVPAEQCRLYNTDYSLWKTVQFNIPNNKYLTDIKFVSQHLFNTDDLVEMAVIYSQYVETSTSYYYIYTTEIVNENGTVLLSVAGSSWLEVTSSDLQGSRLTVYVYDYSSFPYAVQTRVYSIPGMLTGMEPPAEWSLSQTGQARIDPNPLSGPASIRIQEGPLQQAAWLVIRDQQGRLCSQTLLDAGVLEQQLNLVDLEPGIYIYEVISPFYRSKPSRFVKAQ